METRFLRAFGQDCMKHAYNTRKRKMWESKIRIYWIGISSRVILWQNLPVVFILNLCSLLFLSSICLPSHCFPLNFYWHLYFWMKTKFNECELEYHNQYIDYAVGWTYEPRCDTDHSPHLLSRFRMSGSAPTCPICLHLVHRDNMASPCFIF
jgi:hypothetical protein